jgi:hypothetical protein
MGKGIIAAAVLVLVCLSAFGDTLVTKDGRTLEGRVITQDNLTVVFEAWMYGSKVVMNVEATNVVSLTKGELSAAASKPAPPASKPSSSPAITKDTVGIILPAEPTAPQLEKYEGPTYYVIPMRGEVGIIMRASVLEKCFEDAVARKPDVVVLDFDSPGGHIAEVEKLLDVIGRYRKKVRVVAYVKRAISAAAITAMASNEIYMRPAGLIGAATAYKLNVMSRVPSTLDEKMNSVWRATGRSAAEMGDHPKELAEAMIDATVVLYLEEADGVTKVTATHGSVYVPPGSRQPVKGTLFKPSGKLLTMTAGEAKQTTLASGVCDDYADLGKALKLEKWTECKGIGEAMANHSEACVEAIEKEFRKRLDSYVAEVKVAAANERGPVVYSGTSAEYERKLRETQVAYIRAVRAATKALDGAIAIIDKYPTILIEYMDIVIRFKQEHSYRERRADQIALTVKP